MATAREIIKSIPEEPTSGMAYILQCFTIFDDEVPNGSDEEYYPEFVNYYSLAKVYAEKNSLPFKFPELSGNKLENIKKY